MARSPWLSLPSFPQHVIQCGNNRMPSCRRLKEEARAVQNELLDYLKLDTDP